MCIRVHGWKAKGCTSECKKSARSLHVIQSLAEAGLQSTGRALENVSSGHSAGWREACEKRLGS